MIDFTDSPCDHLSKPEIDHCGSFLRKLRKIFFATLILRNI
uniref:Uncharacterized protein n=1 Tax=Rhizophora mucronata TaxID=61149 RepID=A0A2P2P2T5_RHIMU